MKINRRDRPSDAYRHFITSRSLNVLWTNIFSLKNIAIASWKKKQTEKASMDVVDIFYDFMLERIVDLMRKDCRWCGKHAILQKKTYTNPSHQPQGYGSSESPRPVEVSWESSTTWMRAGARRKEADLTVMGLEPLPDIFNLSTRVRHPDERDEGSRYLPCFQTRSLTSHWKGPGRSWLAAPNETCPQQIRTLSSRCNNRSWQQQSSPANREYSLTGESSITTHHLLVDSLCVIQAQGKAHEETREDNVSEPDESELHVPSARHHERHLNFPSLLLSRHLRWHTKILIGTLRPVATVTITFLPKIDEEIKTQKMS